MKKNEEQIIRDRIANSLLHDPNHNFWSEIRKIRYKRSANCRIVDGCTDEESVAQMFALKYAERFNSVSYNSQEMQNIIDNELRNAPDLFFYETRNEQHVSGSCLHGFLICNCHHHECIASSSSSVVI